MPRPRLWTSAEDMDIRRAAAANRSKGLTTKPLWITKGDELNYTNRLHEVARKHRRSYAAVRKRATRIGARSYRKKAPD